VAEKELIEVLAGIGISALGVVGAMYLMSWLYDKTQKKVYESWKFVMEESREIETRNR